MQSTHLQDIMLLENCNDSSAGAVHTGTVGDRVLQDIKS